MPDTTNDAPLSLERFAEVSAYLIHFKAVDEAEILRRLAVRPEDLAATRKAWTDRLGNDVPRGQVTHALTLAKAYATAKARLEAERPDVASIGQTSSGDTRPPSPPMPEATVEPHAAQRSPTAPPPPPTFAAPLPFTPHAEAHHGDTQGAIRVRANAAPAHVPDAPSLRTEPSTPPDPRLYAALPFRQPTPPAAELAGAGTTRDAVATRDDGAPHAGSGLTSRQAFSAASTSTLPPPRPDDARPEGALPFKRAPLPGSAPFRPAQPSPSLTLEQYASLCVDSELDPGGRALTAPRYGLTPDQHAQVDAQFRALFLAHPAQYDAFQHARRIYRAWRLQVARR